MTTEVEDTLKKIQAYEGVTGMMVLTGDGVAIKSTLDDETSVQYAALVTQLCDKARMAAIKLDPSNDITFLRMRTKKHELLIAPDRDFLLLVIQKPSK